MKGNNHLIICLPQNMVDEAKNLMLSYIEFMHSCDAKLRVEDFSVKEKLIYGDDITYEESEILTALAYGYYMGSRNEK